MFGRLFRGEKKPQAPPAVRCLECQTPLLASAETPAQFGSEQMRLFCPKCLRVAGAVYRERTLEPDLGDTHTAGTAVWTEIRR